MSTSKGLPPLLVSTQRIWEYADHNAFTDLFVYNDKFYVAFRESNAHYKAHNGTVRIISSKGGAVWETVAFVEQEGIDLRDPKLSLLPNGSICLLMGGSFYNRDKELVYTSTWVCFAQKDFRFEEPIRVLEKNEWLWRLTWYQGIGYGIAYHNSETETYVTLYQTADALQYTKMAIFDVESDPSEATIRFDSEGKMIVIIRRDESYATHALMGESYAPFMDWSWVDVGYSIGGPNFLILPQEELWLSGRLIYVTPYGYFCKTALLKFEETGFRRTLFLPSFGDTSYPGMVFHGGYLWISYYSSHEGKSSIYFSKILLSATI